MNTTSKNIILFTLTILGFVFTGIAVATNKELEPFGWVSLGCFVAAFGWLYVKDKL